jgi:hypothetical protein
MPFANSARDFLNKFISPQVPPPQPGNNTSFQDYADSQFAQKWKNPGTMPYGPQSPAPSSYPSFQDYANFR